MNERVEQGVQALTVGVPSAPWMAPGPPRIVRAGGSSSTSAGASLVIAQWQNGVPVSPEGYGRHTSAERSAMSQPLRKVSRRLRPRVMVFGPAGL